MKRLAFVLGILLALAMPVAAQDSSQAAQNAVNYCTSELAYDLPNGWVVGETARTPAATSAKIGSSSAALLKNLENLDPDEAVIYISVISQTSLTESLSLESDADISVILQALLKASGGTGYSFSDVSTRTIQDRPAAQQDAHAGVSDQYFAAFKLESNQIAFLILSATFPQADHWKAVTLDLAESLHLESVRAPEVEGSLPLTQVYGRTDCSLSFVFPPDWTLFNAARRMIRTRVLTSQTMLPPSSRDPTLIRVMLLCV